MENHEINPFEHYTVVFKALSDLTRLKIMWLLLSIDSKICVSEIIDVLKENQYNVSKHLKILKNAGLIYEKKEGKWTFYHYRTSNAAFDREVRQTVMTIPEELMADEILRCQKRLAMRLDGKCTVNCENEVN
jgi:ArsR family transcriptional regulator